MNDDPPLALPAPEQPKLLPAPAGMSAPNPQGRRHRFGIVAIAVAVLAVLLAIGWYFHHREATLAAEASERARDRLPSVSAIRVESSPSTSALRLPGSITPLTEASLFARSSGYVTARYVDIGDTVHRGQVLAEIDSPDLDQQVAMARQQLAQARSNVNDARARVELSRVTYDRLRVLVRDQAVAQQQVDQGRQDVDTARAGVASSNANVGAAEANLQRLVVLQGYEKLKAPFDGIVTARSFDVGALVNPSGSSASSASSGGASTGGASSASQTPMSSGGGDAQGGTELFRIAQADRVRVFVTVPQENAASVEPDSEAQVFVAGVDQPFAGRVTRTARSLDPSARTLLTEVQVANQDHRLVPGMYAQVGFHSPRNGAPLLVPGEAVIARADGLHVAVLEDLRPEDRARLPKADPSDQKASKGDDKGGGKDDAKGGDGASGSSRQDDNPAHAKRIHLQTVAVGRDYGNEIEITRGLTAGMTIVANPGDEVADGALVIPQTREAGKGKDPGGKRGEPAGDDTPPPGNRSPSMQAPTKGRK